MASVRHLAKSLIFRVFAASGGLACEYTINKSCFVVFFHHIYSFFVGLQNL